MTVHVYKLDAGVYRGYVKKYEGARVLTANCKEVRTTYAEAEKDAKKLLKELTKTK